jgi:hypothetical protein
LVEITLLPTEGHDQHIALAVGLSDEVDRAIGALAHLVEIGGHIGDELRRLGGQLPLPPRRDV